MTKIEWTHAAGYTGETWNPIAAFDVATGKRGWFCVKVSDGCKNCYAESRNRHIGNGHKYALGNRDKVRFELAGLDKPFHWAKPRMIFVCSMTDLFQDGVPDEMIAEVFAAMFLCERHIFQVLTKRPARMRELLTADAFRDAILEAAGPLWQHTAWARDESRSYENWCAWVNGDGLDGRMPDNIWLGTSVENQVAWNHRVPELAQTPATVRFLSCEPLLDRLDLCLDVYGNAIHWVIVGGESGTSARETLLSSVSSVVEQCAAANVACFVKQLGRDPFDDGAGVDAPLILSDHKGGTIEEWPERFRVRQWPLERAV